MALFAPSESPAVIVKEIDLTNAVPNVQSSTGAFAGAFRWGPVEEPRLITSEAGLVETFGSPKGVGTEETESNQAITYDFHTASYFLKYSNAMQVVRSSGDSMINAGVDGQTHLIKNKEAFDAWSPIQGKSWLARYPGKLGNSIAVHMMASESDGIDASEFSSWTYATHFNSKPGTSAYVAQEGGLHDEMHVAVVDSDGLITGTKGSILETYSYVSKAGDARNADGTTNYIKDVINNKSNYVYLGNVASLGSVNADPVTGFGPAVGKTTAEHKDFSNQSGTQEVQVQRLSGGLDGNAPSLAQYQNGFNQFADVDTIEVDFLMSPGMSSRTNQTTITNHLTSIATSRKDCVAVSSPARSDVVGNIGGETTDAVSTADTFTNSSYLIVDNNYLKIYDKYNDKFIHIPAASSTAGLMAATDRNSAPWFSPAGPRRGAYLGITGLAYNPTKGERDTLYKAGVNPIANIPGQGLLLYGDKTHQNRASAFDRINVRRLFLVLERAIARAAQNVMFEFNDEFTRAEFVGIIEPVLRNVQGRRGITDFKLVCDETNNGPEIVDANQFVANIFIKPARSINFITLNFVAVRSGVAFEEVVGTV
jgi:hypothetical protein